MTALTTTIQLFQLVLSLTVNNIDTDSSNVAVTFSERDVSCLINYVFQLSADNVFIKISIYVYYCSINLFPLTLEPLTNPNFYPRICISVYKMGAFLPRAFLAHTFKCYPDFASAAFPSQAVLSSRYTLRNSTFGHSFYIPGQSKSICC